MNKIILKTEEHYQQALESRNHCLSDPILYADALEEWQSAIDNYLRKQREALEPDGHSLCNGDNSERFTKIVDIWEKEFENERTKPQFPIVYFNIVAESGFVLESGEFEKLAGTSRDEKIESFCKEYSFEPESIESVDFTQTMSRKELNELKEWGSF